MAFGYYIYTNVFMSLQSFLDYFARAIQYEYKDQGIVVQSLMPFYVTTKMTRFSETLSRPSILIPSAAEYARHAITTLGYTSRTTGYWPHTIQVHNQPLVRHVLRIDQSNALRQR